MSNVIQISSHPRFRHKRYGSPPARSAFNLPGLHIDMRSMSLAGLQFRIVNLASERGFEPDPPLLDDSHWGTDGYYARLSDATEAAIDYLNALALTPSGHAWSVNYDGGGFGLWPVNAVRRGD